jgi:outer membrane protein TolC
MQLLRALREEIKLSEEREKIADRKMQNGSGSRLDWLEAKTEFNRQQSLLIQLESKDVEARLSLNRIMGIPLEEGFTIPDTVIIDYNPDFAALKKSVAEQNNTLKFYDKDLRISEAELRETKSLRSPVIWLNGRYGYTKTSNEAGFVLLNKSNGFYYGANLTFPIFNGFNIRQQIRNSKLNVSIANLSLESATQQVNQDLLNAWRNFRDNIQLLKMEEENIGYAREVLSIAHERYRIGLSSVVDLQEAQRTFENAMTRVTDARYNTKISETSLRKLNGELIK